MKTDRMTKILLAMIAVLLLTNRFELTPSYAQVSQPCVWTYISDQRYPSIGQDGEIDLSESNWGRLSEQGWSLKTAFAPNGWTSITYVFEKCS